MKLLVGLGNPGFEYQNTRHNAGFWWIDSLATALNLTLYPEKAYKGLVARANAGDQAFWLLKPQTFMNLSGQSVASLANFYKIQPENILVIHDELDLPAGEIRLKLGGGHAGHNGLRDIHAQLGSSQYWRLRIGIGHPGVRAEVSNWVLQKPSTAHRVLIDHAIAHSQQAVSDLLAGKLDAAMRTIHSKPKA